jgi:hypothetical protein
MGILEMIRFFQSIIFDESEADTLSRLVRLLVWGDFVTRTGCITPDGFDVDMTKMDGDMFQLQFQRQLLLRSPSFFMKFEQALEQLEATDEAHAKLSRKTTDDATHFSDGYESLGQLDDSKPKTKKIQNIDITDRFDFSQVSDTPIEPNSTSRRTSFGFVGTSDTLIKKKERLKRIEIQSPLHRKGNTSDPAEILRLKNSIPTNLYRRSTIVNPFIMPSSTMVPQRIGLVSMRLLSNTMDSAVVNI